MKLGGLLAILLLAAPARADLPAEVSIRWKGDCPRPFGLESEVSQLLGGKRPQLTRTEFEIDVDAERDGYELTLEVDSASHDAERTVRVASCQEAQDAAVLLIATAIDPDAILQVQKPPPKPPKPPKPPGPKAPPYRWSLRLQGLFDLKALPGATFGPSLGGLWQDRHWRAWLDAHYLAARTASASQADLQARLDLFAGALGGAYLWSWGAFGLGPAVELEFGALRARDVRGQVTSRNAVGPWGSVQVGGVGTYRATERIGVELGVFAGVPLWRPELSAGGLGSFYTTAPATMRLALGIRVSLGSP